MTQPLKLKTWVPWSELTGTSRVKIQEFRALLSRYTRYSILIACAKLSVAFDYGPDARTVSDTKTTAKWIPELFPPALIPDVMFLLKQDRVIFFQAQLRFLAAEAIRLKPVPNDTQEPVPNQILGALLLQAGELLYKPHVPVEDHLDVRANQIAEFLPVYEFASHTDAFFNFLRFHIFLTVNIPRLAAPLKNFDVPFLFHNLFGFPLEAYTNFIAAFAVHALMERGNTTSPEIAIDGALRTSWFKNTVLSSDLIDKMFESVSLSLDNLPPPNDTLGYADFEFLKDRPYLLHQNQMYMLDYEFALGKLESAALWRLFRSLPANQKDAYLSFWGHVFEDYVAWLFEEYASPAMNVLYPSPTYLGKEDKQICDAIIVCGSTAILIEAKLATCKASIRYSGDYKKMKKYLEDRLVTGTNRPVGVAQFLKAIDAIVTSPSLLPTWLIGIKKFIPVIITKDDIGSSWAVNAYLNRRFKDQLSRKKHKKYIVTPLVSMNVSSLERMVWTLSKMPFSEVLEDRMKSDRELSAPFDAACQYVREGAGPKLTKHIEIFEQMSDKLISDFGMKEAEIQQAGTLGV